MDAHEAPVEVRAVDVRTFESWHAPGDAARVAVLLRAQSDALAWASFAVMTVTLAAVLQGSAVLVPFAVGMAAAFAGSALVASARLRRAPARVEVSGATARLWSVWDAAAPAHRPEAQAVWEARLVRGEIVVSLGDAVETLQRADWPDFDGLAEALRNAAVPHG